MAQKVATKAVSTVVSVSPLARVIRTIVQTVGAFAAAEPVLIGGLGLTATRASEIAGVVSALVAAASILQNVAEHFGILPVAGGKAAASAAKAAA